MVGKNHIITNTCSLISISSGVAWLNKFATNIANSIADFTTKMSFQQSVIVGGNNIIQQLLAVTFLNNGNIPIPLFLLISMAAFYIGTLFPDIDNENSMLGKFLYLPVEHRTWTHAIWLPICFGLLALLSSVMWWFVLGYILHLIWDNMSRGGVCFLYPITKYRYFGNSGAKIKNGHFVYLYRTNKTSEGVVVGVVATIAVVILIIDIVNGLFLC